MDVAPKNGVGELILSEEMPGGTGVPVFLPDAARLRPHRILRRGMQDASGPLFSQRRRRQLAGNAAIDRAENPSTTPASQPEQRTPLSFAGRGA